MKKVLLVSYFYLPIINGGVQRIRCMKKYLADYGYEVTILACGNFGTCCDEQNIIRIDDIGEKYRHNTKAIITYPTKILIKSAMYVGLIYDWFHFWRNQVLSQIERKTDLKQFDFIIASYPPIIDLRIGIDLSKKYNIPLVIDYRDGLLFEPFPYIFEQSKVYQSKIKKLEKEVADMSKMHIVVNEKMKEYYSEKYKETKCSVISNGFDNEEIIEDIEIKGLPEGFNVIYTGGLSSSREIYSMPIICTIIEQNKDVNFVFVGEYLKSEKQALSLYSNVYLIDKVEREKVLLIQRKAKLLLLISGENTSGTSTKLYEYLFSNIPILNIGGKNIATKIIEETKTGKTFLPTELEQIKIYINQVKNGEYFITPQNLKKYTRREQCRQLAKYLDDLSKESDR